MRRKGTWPEKRDAVTGRWRYPVGAYENFPGILREREAKSNDLVGEDWAERSELDPRYFEHAQSALEGFILLLDHYQRNAVIARDWQMHHPQFDPFVPESFTRAIADQALDRLLKEDRIPALYRAFLMESETSKFARERAGETNHTEKAYRAFVWHLKAMVDQPE